MSSGFTVKRLEETYHGQFLCLEALPAEEAPTDPIGFSDLKGIAALEPLVAAFADTHRDTAGYWRRLLTEQRHSGQRTVVWGSGSKGVSFLNVTAVPGAIDYVDINPRKQGKFVAGGGQQVVAPSFLVDYRPELVLVMNPAYLGEISCQLADLGVGAPVRDIRDVSLVR